MTTKATKNRMFGLWARYLGISAQGWNGGIYIRLPFSSLVSSEGGIRMLLGLGGLALDSFVISRLGGWDSFAAI